MAGDNDAMDVDAAPAPAEAAEAAEAPAAEAPAAAPAPAAAEEPAAAAEAPAPAPAAPVIPVTPAGPSQDETCEAAVKATLDAPDNAGERIRNAAWAEAPDDVADCVELAARQLLYEALDKEDDTTAKKIVSVLVDHTVHCEQCGDRGPVLNVAHKLLEDCIDAAPSTNADSWWDLVESHKGALTENPAIFKAGKFILLRLCNSLLKRLSRTRQATLCGRILMFMAAAWPLSEKSALNMKGLCHTDNVTEFESSEQFDAQNADDDFDDAGDGAPKEDYDTYSGFWSVQKYLSNPPSCFKDVKGFLASVDVTCSALERTACTPDEFERERAAMVERQAQPMNVEPEDDTQQMLGSQKYLTNSRLLRIQLRDPQLRTQVCSQLYMVLDYLRRELEGMNARDWASEPKARVRKILAGTPPTGPEAAGSLDLLLEHEVQWAAWKKKGCPPFEKEPLPEKPKQKRPYYAPPLPEVLKRKQARRDALEKKRKDEEPPLEEKCRRLASQIPTLKEHLQEWRDADDPAEDVDDEYHPRHDPVWKFRALRLVMKEKLPWFADMHDANIEVAVDKMFPDRPKRTDRPKPPPPPPKPEKPKKRVREESPPKEEDAKRSRKEEDRDASPRSRRERSARDRPEPRGRGAETARGGRKSPDESKKGGFSDKRDARDRKERDDDKPRGRGARAADDKPRGRDDDAKARAPRGRGADESRERSKKADDDKPARGRKDNDDKPRGRGADESRERSKRDDKKAEAPAPARGRSDDKPRGRGADESRERSKKADDDKPARGRKADDDKPRGRGADESRERSKRDDKDSKRDDKKAEAPAPARGRDDKPARGRGADESRSKRDDKDSKRDDKKAEAPAPARGRKDNDDKPARGRGADESRERSKRDDKDKDKDAKAGAKKAEARDEKKDSSSRDRRRDAKEDDKASPRDRRRAKKADDDEAKPKARGRGAAEDKKRGRSPEKEDKKRGRSPEKKRGRSPEKDEPARKRGRGGDDAPPARRGGRAPAPAPTRQTRPRGGRGRGRR